MNSYRDAGPAYPTEVIDEFATITFVRDCGANDDSVIACAASELPKLSGKFKIRSGTRERDIGHVGLTGMAVFMPQKYRSK